ncbi:reverse transcriptase family protein [Pseudomonas aeruginosa]|nr:reverse transcriptase family protein [Pseudomonas aeruginosa]
MKCSKQFWRFVKSKRSAGDFPNELFLNDRCSSDGSEICNLFNVHFGSAFLTNNTQSASSLSYTPASYDLNCVDISSFFISVGKVKQYLKNLDISKGAGPDGIPPVFLRQCYAQLCYPLHLLFNHSLSTKAMPRIWKRSFVVPVFKSGDKHNIANYRPISKICAIPKMFERIVYDFLFPLIRPHIIEQQHGFISHRSTETNLCEFLDYVLSSMEDGHQVDVVYTDYSKAFDRINFDILIEKLHGLGVHGDLLRWLESYVRDRSQAVTFNGFCSSFAPVPSGVPQGSHLGPMLFNIYVNDVSNVFRKSKFIMYADDKKVYKVIKSLNDCLELQDDLNNLFVYCQNNLQ